MGRHKSAVRDSLRAAAPESQGRASEWSKRLRMAEAVAAGPSSVQAPRNEPRRETFELYEDDSDRLDALMAEAFAWRSEKAIERDPTKSSIMRAALKALEQLAKRNRLKLLQDTPPRKPGLKPKRER